MAKGKGHEPAESTPFEGTFQKDRSITCTYIYLARIISLGLHCLREGQNNAGFCLILFCLVF